MSSKKKTAGAAKTKTKAKAKTNEAKPAKASKAKAPRSAKKAKAPKSAKKAKAPKSAKKAKAPKLPKLPKVAKGSGLTAAEITHLEALPREYEAPPEERLQDAAQNARNAQKAFEEYASKLVKGSDLPADAGRRLEAARDTFERAESAWSKTRSNVPSVAAARKEGEKLKSAMLGALRYFLRADADVAARCDKIVEGTGDVDLADDLEKVAVLFVEHSAKLRKADVPKGAVTRAGELAALLVGGAAKRKVNPEQTAALLLRNRALHAMDALVDEILEAGRYVFRDDPKHKKAFRRIVRPVRRR